MNVTALLLACSMSPTFIAVVFYLLLIANRVSVLAGHLEKSLGAGFLVSLPCILLLTRRILVNKGLEHHAAMSH
jgi:hypothetical protein